MARGANERDAKPETIRCAIYTRKSTEEGLEQDFNSLDAQREACEAYIVSQRHEGWVLHPELYDDGGFSGGNMDRPGLTQLMADVQSGKVDVIVVYKVDRLTRSLADFAKIVEILDEAEASFVSVTQSFNTTTSMGRLTLNVLLSFAQFEREVTGERIRDKIAASKAKGMWMGGTVSFGYEVKDRKLHIVPDEATTVRHIFNRYLELASVPALADELEDAGVRSRKRISRTGRPYGGAILSRGAVYAMLQNRIYVGETVHKGKVYPGEHEAIIDRDVFETIEQQLERNRVERMSGAYSASPSLLTGLVYDALDRRMSPDHAHKSKRKYRYYASRQNSRADCAHPKWRVPAIDLEEIVVGRLKVLLTDRQALTEVAGDGADVQELERIFEEADARADQLLSDAHTDRRALITDLIKRVTVRQDQIDLQVTTDRLVGRGPDGEEAADIILSVKARIINGGKQSRIVIPPTEAIQNIRRDASLIKLVAKAYAARKAVEVSHKSVNDVARAEGYDKDYFARLVRLGYLAPDIITAILDGRQPATLTRIGLARTSNLPLDWSKQRRLLGFE